MAVKDTTLEKFIFEFSDVQTRLAAHRETRQDLQSNLREVEREIKRLEAKQKRLFHTFHALFSEFTEEAI